jgi:glycosyltransferase involved in cell wall biosynthesis
VEVKPVNNSKSDFDIVLEDKFPLKSEALWRRRLRRYKIFYYICSNFDILHFSYNFTFFDKSKYWFNEKKLIEFSGCKVISAPYGGDVYLYEDIMDKSFAHSLNISLPNAYKERKIIKRNIDYWVQNSDFLILSYMLETIPRWDILPYAFLGIDEVLWKSTRQNSTEANGKNGKVKIAHSPNFRGIKGTEFLIESVDTLIDEGLDVELILIENLPNEKVREIITNDADILVEQLYIGYAMSGMEGMAAGLPVVTNLSNEIYTRVFRRFSQLDECPIVSGTPENLTDVLRCLVTNPNLRSELGKAGVEYIDKYHSNKAMSDMFSEIYKKVWRNEEITLIHYFNSKSHESPFYNTPKVKHPLVENRIVND